MGKSEKLGSTVGKLTAAMIAGSTGIADTASAQWVGRDTVSSPLAVAGTERAGQLWLHPSPISVNKLQENRNEIFDRLQVNLEKASDAVTSRRNEFERLGRTHLAAAERSRERMMTVTPAKLAELLKRNSADLATLKSKMIPGGFAIFVDAASKEAHVIQLQADGGLQFIISSPAVTGDGLEINPGKKSNATRHGLSYAESPVAGHMIAGEDVGYYKDRPRVSGIEFEIMGKNGLKKIYMTPRPGFAAVETLRIDFYGGQALHFGPQGDSRESHGCVRLPLDMAVALYDMVKSENSLGHKVPIFISGPLNEPGRINIGSRTPLEILREKYLARTQQAAPPRNPHNDNWRKNAFGGN